MTHALLMLHFVPSEFVISPGIDNFLQQALIILGYHSHTYAGSIARVRCYPDPDVLHYCLCVWVCVLGGGGGGPLWFHHLPPHNLILGTVCFKSFLIIQVTYNNLLLDMAQFASTQLSKALNILSPAHQYTHQHLLNCSMAHTTWIQVINVQQLSLYNIARFTFYG